MDSGFIVPNKKHPIASFFHLFFRLSALIVYLICNILSSSFVVKFLLVVFCLSLDFWTVKNVTGRLLVGLRWWNYVDEEGESHWMFESKKDWQPVSFESQLFWIGLFACPLIWTFFLLSALLSLKLQWLLLCVVGICLNGANVIGYFYCRKDGGQQIKTMAGKFIGQQLMTRFTGGEVSVGAL